MWLIINQKTPREVTGHPALPLLRSYALTDLSSASSALGNKEARLEFAILPEACSGVQQRPAACRPVAP